MLVTMSSIRIELKLPKSANYRHIEALTCSEHFVDTLLTQMFEKFVRKHVG